MNWRQVGLVPRKRRVIDAEMSGWVAKCDLFKLEVSLQGDTFSQLSQVSLDPNHCGFS